MTLSSRGRIKSFALRNRLFDHLVGQSEDSRRNVETDGLRGFQIEDHFETGGLLHRQVGGLFALQHPGDVEAGLAPGLRAARAITDQAAGLGVIAKYIERSDSIARSKHGKMLGIAVEKRTILHNKRPDLLACDICKDVVKISRTCCVKGFHRPAQRASSRLDIGQTVIVKNGTVLAVEGFEGTNETIKRGGALGGKNAIMVKVAKPNQDMRFDVPVIGVETVGIAVEAHLRVIAVETGRTLLLEKEALMELAARSNISIIAQ